MSWFNWLNWFTGRSTPPPKALASAPGSVVRRGGVRLRPARHKSISLPPAKDVAAPANHSEARKVKRHARREQLYLVVRGAFTHAGVLSATYRFKVLSLDQTGNEFLVMVDVDQFFDHRAEKLAEVEARIVQTAKTGYDMRVTAVYWRVATPAAIRNSETVARAAVKAAVVQHPGAANPVPSKTSSFRYSSIQDDELAASKPALVAASADRSVAANAAAKARNNPRSYALLTGFEDTEMPESARMPVLSATQYGDLN